MKLVIGGAFQGKHHYVKQTFQIEEGWVDGEACAWNDIYDAKVILHFHDYIRRRLADKLPVNTLAADLIEKNPDVIVICNEMGYGVVPVEAFDREYRETVGRISQELAAASDEVHRVVCALGVKIKG